ncbi:hypothetical protein FB157_112148 [Streptomyces sp. BK340]|nr:hypothetical protein FB157_112148 [Streptomyces sp. BK340]
MPPSGVVHRGNSQFLDHILTSPAPPSYDYDTVHTNTESADRAGGHGPQIVRLGPWPPRPRRLPVAQARGSRMMVRSSHRPNLVPTSGTVPTCWNPNRSCSRIDAVLPASMSAMTTWWPASRAAVTRVASSAEPMPSPCRSSRT